MCDGVGGEAGQRGVSGADAHDRGPCGGPGALRVVRGGAGGGAGVAGGSGGCGGAPVAAGGGVVVGDVGWAGASGPGSDPRLAAWVVVAAWRVGLSVRASTLEKYDSHLRIHILPRFGRMRLSELSRVEVRTWALSLTHQGMAGSSVCSVVALLSGILAEAVREGLMAPSAAARWRLYLVRCTRSSAYRGLRSARGRRSVEVEQRGERAGSMLPAEEGAAFIYLMASQRDVVRLAGLESLNSSVIASPCLFRDASALRSSCSQPLGPGRRSRHPRSGARARSLPRSTRATRNPTGWLVGLCCRLWLLRSGGQREGDADRDRVREPTCAANRLRSPAVRLQVPHVVADVPDEVIVR